MIFMIMKKILIGGCGYIVVWLRVWSIPVGHSGKLATMEYMRVHMHLDLYIIILLTENCATGRG